MRAADINAGSDYAYVDPDFPHDPVRATALEPADDGVVLIEIHHPDTGTDQITVATRAIAGVWAEFADRAAERYALVGRQRALARRLLDVTGIVRDAAPYAGRGGAGANAQHRMLQLNFDELEELLSRAENPPGAAASRGAVAPEQVTVP